MEGDQDRVFRCGLDVCDRRQRRDQAIGNVNPAIGDLRTPVLDVQKAGAVPFFRPDTTMLLGDIKKMVRALEY